MAENFLLQYMQGVAAAKSPAYGRMLLEEQAQKQALLEAQNMRSQMAHIVEPLQQLQTLSPEHQALIEVMRRAGESGLPGFIEKTPDLLSNMQDRSMTQISPTDLVKDLMAMGIDPRSKDGQQIMLGAMMKPQTQVNMGRPTPPSGYNYRTNSDELYAIPGGPHDPLTQPLTDAQGKASGYYNRAVDADKVINELENKISVSKVVGKQQVERIPGVGQVLGGLANTQLSPEEQSIDAAEKAFILSILRQESQGTITDEEFETYKKTYFPQPGESKKSIEFKRNLRKQAISGLKDVSGLSRIEKMSNGSSLTKDVLDSGSNVTNEIRKTDKGIQMKIDGHWSDLPVDESRTLKNGKTIYRIGSEWFGD